MQRSPVQQQLGSRRLEKACRHVNDLWFPVNPDLMTKIQHGLKNEIYELNPEALISEIRSDFSLFTYCLRELLRLLREDGIEIAVDANPLDLLREAGLQRLRSIVDVKETAISKHTLQGLDKEQAARIQEALVSASCAEVLSPTFNVSPEVGYSVALLRQLGHTLIAWNYPTYYQEAVQEIKQSKRQLDLVIAERLGFSPSLLAIKIMHSWGAPAGFCAAVFAEEHGPTGEGAAEEQGPDPYYLVGEMLSKLCSVGEALARANNPDIYPSAVQDWEFARDEIGDRLGDDGLRCIQEKLFENFESYVNFVPDMFSGGMVLDPGLQIVTHRRDEVLRRNPFIRNCAPDTKAHLMQLYLSIDGGSGVAEKGLSTIVKEIVPQAGFDAGCIYTIDPTLMLLVPQTKIGETALRDIKPVDYSVIASDADLVAIAYGAVEPVVKYGLTKLQNGIASLAGVIGFSTRVGVLYLELPQERFSLKEEEYMMHFRAISQALNDCLNLR